MILDTLKSWLDRVFPWHISKTIWIFSISLVWVLYYWNEYNKDFHKLDAKKVIQEIKKVQCQISDIIAP